MEILPKRKQKGTQILIKRKSKLTIRDAEEGYVEHMAKYIKADNKNFFKYIKAGNLPKRWLDC